MPRDRQRITLESGPKLDLAKLIPSGAGRPGHIQCVLTYGSGETITAALQLWDDAGLLELSYQGHQQSFPLVSDQGTSAGCNGAPSASAPDGGCGFCIDHLAQPSSPASLRGGRRAAYTSQLLDPIGRAWRTNAKVKARLLGSADPDEWDLPPKPKGMRWATFERWVARYDAAEEMLDAQLVVAAARLMRRA